jgi:hypothetical protein
MASPELRQQFTALLLPVPPPPVPVPRSDLESNQSIMAAVQQISIDVIATSTPTLAATHLWYKGISSFIGVSPLFPLDAFQLWVHPPRILSSDELAAACYRDFISSHPWAEHCKGVQPDDPLYQQLQSQMNVVNPRAPPPVIPVNLHLPLVFMQFIYFLESEYYRNDGTICLSTLFKDNIEYLQSKINPDKYPLYSIDNVDFRYQFGYVLFSNRQHLLKESSILFGHFKTILQQKTSIADELHSRIVYLKAVQDFFRMYAFAFTDTDWVYSTYKLQFTYGFAHHTVKEHAKLLLSSCKSMPALIAATIHDEDVITRDLALTSIAVKPAAAGVHVNPAAAAGAHVNPAAAAIAAGVVSAATAAAAPPRHKHEGKKARHVTLKFCTNPTCNKSTEHTTFTCPVRCAIATCPCPNFDHATKHCHFIRSPSAKEYFAAFEVRRHPSLLPSSRCRSLPANHLRALKSSSLPTIKYDTGANVIVSPVPLSSASISPCDDVIHVANGDAVPISSITSLGNQPCYIAPSFTDALIPQSAIESQGALSVLHNKQLLIFDATTNPALTTAISSSTPLIVSNQRDGDYDISLPDVRRLFLTPPPPSCFSCPPTVKTASISRYYTSQFNTLKDLVLYWHVAFDHANENKMLSIVENKCISNLPDQLTPAVIRKYFKATPASLYTLCYGDAATGTFSTLSHLSSSSSRRRMVYGCR